MNALSVLRDLLREDDGATLVEYALVLALLSVGAVVALAAFGDTATQSLNGDDRSLTASGRTPP